MRTLFTPSENGFVRDNMNQKTASEIARELGRPTTSVVNRIRRLRKGHPDDLKIIAVIHGSDCYIPLKSRKYPGLFAVVDKEDFDLVIRYNWFPGKSGRKKIQFKAWAKIGKHTLQMHSLILPTASEIDHKDHDTLNNRSKNLRSVTHAQNMQNASPWTHGTSKYKGVFWNSRNKRWRAHIRINRKKIGLGDHKTEIEAAQAYDRAAITAWGEYAHTNFPRESYNI